MNARFWTPEVREIGDRIVMLTVAQAAELHRYLERVHGVRVAAAVAEQRYRVVGPEPEPAPVPTAFRVVLEAFEPARKISVIKVVRELTGLGLKEAKDLVEAAPRPVKDFLDVAAAASCKAQLEAAGARVSVVGVTA